MGRGKGCGTGRPLFFRCWSCRGWRRQDSGMNVEMTGRVRFANYRGNAVSRSSAWAFEYRCLDCGHIGSSRHTDAERKFERAGFVVPPRGVRWAVLHQAPRVFFRKDGLYAGWYYLGFSGEPAGVFDNEELARAAAAMNGFGPLPRSKKRSA